MAHQRKLIRQAVVALLSSADTAAGTRVKGTRIEPNKGSQLPAISVYTLHDPVVPESMMSAPVELEHKLQLEVAGWVAHKDSYPADDAMDDLAEQIEAAMDVDIYFGGTAGDSVLSETEMQIVELDGHSDPMVGVVTLTYEVTYRQSPAVVGGNITDFITADVKHQPVGGVPSTVPLEDTFTEAQ